MEIVASLENPDAYFSSNPFTCFIGEVKDLEEYCDNINFFDSKINYKIKKIFKIYDQYLNKLDINCDVLNKKNSEISSFEEVIFMILNAISNKAKMILLNYADCVIPEKYKSRFINFLRYINANDEINFVIISNDFVFVNQFIKKVIVIKNGIIKFEGNISNAVKQGYIKDVPILNFINECNNKKNINLIDYLDTKELLKEIYRRVS